MNGSSGFPLAMPDFLPFLGPNSGISVVLTLLGALMMSVTVFNVFVYPFHFSPLRHLPGPTDNVFFLGQAPKFLQISWFPELLCEWSREYPEAAFIRYLNFANSETLFANTIEAYKEVLQTKSAFFVKPAFARQFAHEIIGDGLPFIEGKLHRLRRAAISQGPFSTPRLKTFFPVVQNKAKQLVCVLSEQRNDTGNIEIETSIWKAVLDVIGLETFGLDLNHLESDQSPLFEAFTKMMQPSATGHVVNYINSIIPIRKFLPIQECREFSKCCAQVREFIVGLIAIRHREWQKGHEKDVGDADALQCLLDYSDPSWNEGNVVEYILNLLVLGHDTTACSITWAIHELTCHPECQQRLRDEIMSLYKTCATPGFNDIDKLPYLHNFVREVLRLYCAVAMAPRHATQDIEIAGVMIPKGTVIQLSPAVMNTHPSIWGPAAQTFDPDRWNNLTGDAASAYAFETFHNGPRMCIGKQLSMLEMKVMLAEMVRRFRIEKPLGFEDKPVQVAGPTFTLRPKEKLVVRLVEL
ncbi:benzoate 4-monooxygenase cytochrome P450 [Fusarium albosuccineum]|uniref:Benzoate 4-monooxygenase cytochrome P450 n=1 Tax=Fusarium albosuccineum TaxID=1237068 RepID=A0A8H4P3G9_9HYPO|nr:benzoate 4-monooxygenase cytochrome P450 [Fusarium albosuccineum]